MAQGGPEVPVADRIFINALGIIPTTLGEHRVKPSYHPSSTCILKISNPTMYAMPHVPSTIG
jgi:hypothetical protein